jgi:hypothetical protein
MGVVPYEDLNDATPNTDRTYYYWKFNKLSWASYYLKADSL